MQRKIITMLLTVTLLAPAVAVAAGSAGLGSARQHAIDQSGVDGQILFLDSGNPADGLVVSGRATGLDPAATFVTLVYDAGSVPGGSDACLPTDFSLTSTQMFVATWQVAADGTGTLFSQKTGDAYVPLGSIGAVSIRDVRGPIPQGAFLVACGQVRRTAALD